MPAPAAIWPANRVGRGDVGIGAVIDVQHHRLRALKQDTVRRGRAPCSGSCQDHADERRDLRAPPRGAWFSNSPPSMSGASNALQQRVVMQQQRFDLARQTVGIDEIAGADRAASNLVFIGWAEPRPVVPIFPEPRASHAAGRAWNAAAGLAPHSRRGPDCPARPPTPWPRKVSISFSRCQGTTTTPLPITESLPLRTMPDGSSDNL